MTKEILMLTALQINCLLSPLGDLFLGQTCSVPETGCLNQSADNNEEDAEVYLSQQEVLLQKHPFSNWGPMHVSFTTRGLEFVEDTN